jgi:hypothetical protein
MTSNLSATRPSASSRPADPSPAKSKRSSSTSPDRGATVRQSRGSYRRQLTTVRPGVSEVGVQAKRIAAAILEVLAGVRTPAGAAAALGIGLPRYYVWEERAVQGLVAACEPRPRGRGVSVDRQLAVLERDLAVARRELARHQALARTAQRALGLKAAAEFDPSAAARGQAKAKGRDTPTGTRSRRRRPAARALRAARLLRAEDCSGVNSLAAVQSGHSPPGVGTQPAAGTSAALSAEERKHPADPRAGMT